MNQGLTLKTLLLLVEGQTEKRFATDLLKPYFKTLGVDLSIRIVETSKGHTGGGSKYGHIRNDLLKMLKSPHVTVSTLFDLYALPKDFPYPPDTPETSKGADRARHLEKAFEQDIDCDNFIANLIVHEFEALLFAQPEKFSIWTSQGAVEKLKKIAEKSRTPEDINDGRDTAPSKRIQQIVPQYQKVSWGTNIAQAIGLDAMRASCPHFNSWINRLEAKFSS